MERMVEEGRRRDGTCQGVREPRAEISSYTVPFGLVKYILQMAWSLSRSSDDSLLSYTDLGLTLLSLMVFKVSTKAIAI